jgi:ligand-binding sensor domain-containing protein/two-component sensor histidine kinase
MATEGGLVRFDGYDFTVFDKRSTANMGSDLVNSLFEDSSGHLWVATSGGLLERIGNTFRRYTVQDGLPSDTAWATGEDRLGHIWVATAGGLAQLVEGRFQLQANSGAFDGRLQSPILKNPDGTLWMVSSTAAMKIDPAGHLSLSPLPDPAVDTALAGDGSLWIAAPHSLVHITAAGHITPAALPPNLQLTSIALGKDTLWLGTTSGLYGRISPAAPQPAWRRYGRQDGLPGEAVSRLQVDSSGALVVVTDGGVALYSQSFSTIFDQDGFKGGDVLSLYEDKEGDLWLGSESAGAAILRHSPFATLTSREGLPSDQIRSLASTKSDGLWLGTAAGLSHLRDGRFTNISTSQGLASNEILALAPALKSDSLWVGTPDGLSYFDHNRAVTLTASEGLPDDNIRSLLLAHDQTLWIGTSHGLASLPHADPGQAKSMRVWTKADGLGSNVIGSLLEADDGSLWIGTLNGLSHLVNGRIRNFGTQDGLTTGIVTALSADKAGTLWVGTSGGGLFALRDGRLSHVGTAADYTSGRLPVTVYAIVEDDTGHVWLSSSTGVYRIASSNLQALSRNPAAAIPIQHFDVADGLRLHDCASGGHPEAALTPAGLLWFATQKGASVIDTHDRSMDQSAPPVSIENISVDDLSISPDAQDGFRVPPGHARLAFHYAGLSLATPSKVRYRYQLVRFDRSWIEAGTRRTAYYTNIPPGHYTFRVLASLDGGNWSATVATAHFTIAPHYYQTWWFYTLLALLIAILAWQLYLYRLRQVELRFDAVLSERGRIAREIHDTLAQDIVGISVQLELVSRLMTLSLDSARTQLQQTQLLVRKSLAQARSSIWDLRSSGANSEDLPMRLRTTAKELTRDSGIALQVEIGGTYRAFHRTVEDELLRIAQEAITNAVRHASPHTITVSLDYHATGARLEVRDDGRGFVVTGTKSGPAGHYGIRGMHERAERARGKLEIQSTPGSGTTVIAEAPQG